MPAVTIKDVARAAGVSVGTVSNVFNHPERVSSAATRRVMEAVDSLGFVRNPLAGNLRRGTSAMVGVVVLDIANPFFAEAAVAMENRLREAGLVLALSSSGADARQEAELLRSYHTMQARGILWTPASGDLSLAEEIARAGTPVVLVDAAAESRYVSSVAVDDELGAYLAVQHLVRCGHRRVTFLNGPVRMRQARSRSRGARRAWREAGYRADAFTEVTCEAFTGPAAQARLTAMLRAEGPVPEALFAANDLMALGAYNALRQAGLAIPEDVAVVGFDDIPVAAQFATPLTTVRQPMAELGRTAAEMILEEEQGRHVCLSPTLVTRESTRQRPAATPR